MVDTETLSDKIFNDGHLLRQNVKEFIQKLKERLPNLPHLKGEPTIHKLIDKLAGDKLI